MIGRNIPLPLPVPDWSKPIILALLLLSIGFGVRARVASTRARRLERRQQTLTADLRAMQSALVPELPSRMGDLELSVAYSPAEGPAAGGDFYDAFELDGGRVAIILGDVAGHGHTALGTAARMRYTVRAYVEAGLAPREALKLAGSVFGRSGDGLFTTVAVAVHDPSAASLTYATAGHPPPFTVGPAAHEPLEGCASPPLGWGVRSGCRQTTVPFPRGARLCFFSDGLIEARTDAGLLGRDQLEMMFVQLGPQPSARALLDQVQAQASQIRDDMAACIIEAVGGPSGGPETRLEEMELDPDQLARGQARRFLEACGVVGDEISDLVAHAREIAANHGLALLAVTIPGRLWTVTRSMTPAVAPAKARPAKVVPLPRRSPHTPTTTGPERPKSPTPA